jgi:perosamine synthetase
MTAIMINSKSYLSDIVIHANQTIRDALDNINSSGQRVCFVVDNNRMIGLLSEGDIRRELLKGVPLDTFVSKVMNRDYLFLHEKASIELIQAALNKEGVTHIPILNDEGVLVDCATQLRYHNIPLIKPALDGNELEYVTDCIKTGWISSQGAYVTKFEDCFGRYVGVPNVLAVSNGTNALHLALVALGLGADDEIIVPNFTFIAPVNAILYVGAKPVLVDVDPETWTIDVELIEKAITKKTKAIVPVHLYGQPASLKRIYEIAQNNNLLVIEDCAEALGSFFDGKHVGTHSDAATYSFYGNKTVTTGEGGVVTFKRKVDLEYARLLRDHGMSKERRYWHEYIGFNYRMTNIQAAIGVAQMERVDAFVEKKRVIAESYSSLLKNIKGITLPSDVGPVINSFWLYTIYLCEEICHKRDALIQELLYAGVETRPTFFPANLMPPYKSLTYVKSINKDYSLLAGNSGICLPSSFDLKLSDIERIYNIIKSVLNNKN